MWFHRREAVNVHELIGHGRTTKPWQTSQATHQLAHSRFRKQSSSQQDICCQPTCAKSACSKRLVSEKIGAKLQLPVLHRGRAVSTDYRDPQGKPFPTYPPIRKLSAMRFIDHAFATALRTRLNFRHKVTPETQGDTFSPGPCQACQPDLSPCADPGVAPALFPFSCTSAIRAPL